uniref:C2H2-type domain-containing protein n=1 Tax=Cyprinus carpio TaxID=7962 RepID=A0A8C2HRZ7_CYPCA
MAFIKEESEEVKIEDTFRVKQEDTEEQTDLMPLKEEHVVPNEKEEKEQYETHHDFKTGEESFSWPQIKETFSQKTAHKRGTAIYFPPFHIKKSFNEHGNLKDHRRIHTRKKPFTCQQCGKRFTQKVNLNRHIQIHTGEKPYICQQCGKCFNRKGDLSRHMRIHTGEKPYTCKQCGVSFTHKGNLNRHMRVHTGEESFTCKQCGKIFNRKGKLTVHMRVHTTEICQLCGRIIHKGFLNRHMRIHTGEKSYLCHQCGKSFNRKANLNKHENSH